MNDNTWGRNIDSRTRNHPEHRCLIASVNVPDNTWGCSIERQTRYHPQHRHTSIHKSIVVLTV